MDDRKICDGKALHGQDEEDIPRGFDAGAATIGGGAGFFGKAEEPEKCRFQEAMPALCTTRCKIKDFLAQRRLCSQGWAPGTYIATQ